MTETRAVVTDGLSSAEADRRLQQFGANDLHTHGRSIWADLLPLLTNPVSIILLIAATVSAVIGEHIDASLIIAMVLTGAAIDFFQGYHSRSTIERLRSQVAALASVKRDGQWVDLPRSEVVPGDLIRLHAGDLVPADCRLLTSRNLFIQQSTLTGESLPVQKRESTAPASQSASAENMVFLGTSTVSGFATAEVIATGLQTAFGDIAKHLATRPPETAFDLGLRKFSYFITRIIFLLVLFVLMASLALHRPGLDSLLFAVALAVGLTPDFLPVITSVTLSRGAAAMATHRVIVKNLPAIQNLGSMDVLCTDKTGTITSGVMSLHESVDFAGHASPGALACAAINSRLQDGISSPLDTAIAAAAPAADLPEKVDEVPFDFVRRRVSVAVAFGDGRRQLICKGAPEGIFPVLSSVRGSDGVVVPLTAERMASAQAYCEAQSAVGRRVLAVASRDLPGTQLGAEAEAQMTLEGLLAFEDAMLEDGPLAVATLQKDGVRIKVITGDNELVARHVCQQAGLDPIKIVLGDELDQMTDSALFSVVEDSNVFARVSPTQKLRIVNSLRRRGHVVGFLGDGVNDAPALHAADVGIAAPHAVDVAQDAADVVLLQPGLMVLDQGIREGRRAFGNVTKYLLMGTSSNFGNMLSMAVASVVIPFLPMLPTQVLLNNFLYDLSQLSIPTDNVDEEYYSSPRKLDIAVIRRFMIIAGPISSAFDFLTFYVLLRIFHSTPEAFRTGWFMESLVTQTLVLLIIRTRRNPFKSRPSLFLMLTVTFIVIVGVWLPYSFAARYLQFVALNWHNLFFLILVSMSYLACVEVMKRYLFGHATRWAGSPNKSV